MPMRRLFAFGSVLIGVVLALPACDSAAKRPRTSRQMDAVDAKISSEELRDALEQYTDVFEANIGRAADEIVAASPDRRTRRLALLWQMRVIPMARDTLNQDDPIRGFLDLWTLTLRMQQFLTEGDGRSLFGAQQAIAVAAARASTREIERVADLVLAPAQLGPTRQAVADLAARYPFRGEFSGTVVRTWIDEPTKDSAALQSVLNIPLAPFKAFEGIDNTAQAIKGFTSVAAHMTDVVQALPQDARMQLQLLALEIEDLDSVRSALGSAEQMAASAERLSATAEGLPARLRAELDTLADRLESRQEGLRQTIGEARGLVDSIHSTLRQAESSAVAIDETAQNTARAGDAVTGTVRAIVGMVDHFRALGGPARDATATPGAATAPATQSAKTAAGDDAPRRGFDVLDYARAADAIDHAALQLQRLTVDLRQLGDSRELSGAMRELNAHVRDLVTLSKTSGEALVDQFTWRAILVALVAFALAIVYRLVVCRLLPAPRT